MAKKSKKIVKKTKKSPILDKVPKAQGETIKKTKIRVIGIGGGGGNIVSEIASKVKKATFAVANTDSQALKTISRKVNRFQFGQNLTQGLGTGMNAELGREAAQSEKEKIEKLLENQDLCILVSCLGGGAGSGAAPVFAKISKSLGNLTYGIFTLPFQFEGEKKMEIAKEALKKIKNHLNAITIIPNEKVFQIIDKETPLKQALSVVNKSLAESLGGLIETIYEPGLINIDFADFKTILEGRGRLTYLNTVEVQRKEGSIKDLIEKAINSPLYPYGIRGAKGVLFNIAGEKNLSLSDVNQISKTISELSNPEAKIIFGISQSKKYSEIIKTTLLATGCSMKIFPPKLRKKKSRKKNPAIIEKKEKIVSSLEKPKSRPELKKIKKIKKDLVPETEKKEETKEITNTKKIIPVKMVENLDIPQQVRKNALQIKKEVEEIEQEMLEKEKFWETPAFLRRKLAKDR